FEIKEEIYAVKIALAGRPNVGKSSIFNCIAGEERSIVHEIPGTTRDNINTEIVKNKERFIFIDTAGLRHKSKIKENVEYFSVLRTHRAILEADIVLLILEPDDLISQDKKIAGLILKENKASLIVINKWDLIKDKLNKAELIKYKNHLSGKLIRELDFINYSPIIFVSAKTKEGINNIFKEANFIYSEFTKKIEDKVLSRLVLEALAIHPPPTHKGKSLKIYNVFQSKIMPPTFTFKVNEPKLIHFSYKRYLENKIRQIFGFNGTPIIFKFN
ncbi:MAG: ribosome biogenesis GTPase Der, partial [Armatimonadetes bacterium]|nr:ribosome biogenesis GTPase Der [Armatimonadota bacterium]